MPKQFLCFHCLVALVLTLSRQTSVSKLLHITLGVHLKRRETGYKNNSCVSTIWLLETPILFYQMTRTGFYYLMWDNTKITIVHFTHTNSHPSLKAQIQCPQRLLPPCKCPKWVGLDPGTFTPLVRECTRVLHTHQLMPGINGNQVPTSECSRA